MQWKFELLSYSMLILLKQPSCIQNLCQIGSDVINLLPSLLFTPRADTYANRPTIAKCKKIRMRREEKQEIAELDQSCIISDERRTRRSKSNVKDKTSIKKSRLKYDFGDLSVNSDCSDEGKSGGDEFEQPDRQPYQKRKILESSSDDDDDSKTSFRHKRIKATTVDEIDDSQ